MNSAATVPEAAQVQAPEEPMTFGQYYLKNSGYGTADYDNIWMKLIGGLSGVNQKMKDDYQTYLNNIHNRNEAKAVQSARAWDEYMSNTAYSRGFKDLEKLGINPYLLINQGSTPSTSVGSASKPSYSKPGLQSTSSDKGRNLALIVLAIARLAAAL